MADEKSFCISIEGIAVQFGTRLTRVLIFCGTYTTVECAADFDALFFYYYFRVIFWVRVARVLSLLCIERKQMYILSSDGYVPICDE